MNLGGTVVFGLVLCFSSVNTAEEVLNDHEQLAKRFSMNYLDTAKRFSMNYLDTMDKRFSMNFLDTVHSPAAPKRSDKSYLVHVLGPPMTKKFSMNFLDTLDKPKNKRFTMNFMDTLGQRSLKGFKQHRSHHRREDNGDVSSKRSDDVIAKAKAKTVVENLDLMINFMLERYGLKAVCQSQEWHDLVDVRYILGGMVGNGGKSPSLACFEAQGIAQPRYFP